MKYEFGPNTQTLGDKEEEFGPGFNGSQNRPGNFWPVLLIIRNGVVRRRATLIFLYPVRVKTTQAPRLICRLAPRLVAGS